MKLRYLLPTHGLRFQQSPHEHHSPWRAARPHWDVWVGRPVHSPRQPRTRREEEKDSLQEQKVERNNIVMIGERAPVQEPAQPSRWAPLIAVRSIPVRDMNVGLLSWSSLVCLHSYGSILDYSTQSRKNFRDDTHDVQAARTRCVPSSNRGSLSVVHCVSPLSITLHLDSHVANT